MVSLNLQVSNPEDYDTNCCEDIGSGSYDPSLPDCPSAVPRTVVLDQDTTEPTPEPTATKACSVAKLEDEFSCVGRDMYDYTKKDVQVTGFSEFQSLCCKTKPCLTKVSKGRVLNVNKVCTRPTTLSSGANGESSPTTGSNNTTDSSGAGSADNTDTSGNNTTGSGDGTNANDTTSGDGSSGGGDGVRLEPRMCKSLIEDLELCKDSLCTNVGIDPDSAACVCNGEFENDPYCSACTVNGCDQCVTGANGEAVYRPRINDQFGLADNLGLTTALAIGRWCVECAVHDLVDVFRCTQCQDDVGCTAGIDLNTNLATTLTASNLVPMKWQEQGTRTLLGTSGPNWILVKCDGSEDVGVCFDQQTYTGADIALRKRRSIETANKHNYIPKMGMF